MPSDRSLRRHVWASICRSPEGQVLCGKIQRLDRAIIKVLLRETTCQMCDLLLQHQKHSRPLVRSEGDALDCTCFSGSSS